MIPPITRVLGSFILALGWNSVLGGVPSANNKDAAADPQELKVYFDRWISEKIKATHIPGAIVVAVKDGTLLFSKGYGYADLKKAEAMDPASTLLRVGSISKLFTATAVMQLKEHGLIDMHAGIHHYIEPSILKAYPEPITLHQLLTHTSGMGDKFVGQTVYDANDLLPLRSYLENNMAPPLAHPGEIINYSNLGIAVAGYVVEKVSGKPFAYYAVENIMDPLGMKATTFLPPEVFLPRMALGYNYIFAYHRILPLRHWKPYPASSLVSTGHELARFMIAHLENGSFRDSQGNLRQIFREKTAREMHRQQFALHPQVTGVAYGFWKRLENGQHILWHSGHMPGHRTGLFLLPEHRLGLLIYNNSETRLFEPFISDFLDHFYPNSVKIIRKSDFSSAIKNSKNLAGYYRHNWYPRTTLGKAVAFMDLQGEELRVRAADGGKSLFIAHKLYLPVGPDLFRKAEGDQYAAFLENERGEVTFLYRGGTLTYHRLPWYESINFHRPFLITVMSLFTFSFLLWVVSWDRLRRKKNSTEVSSLVQLIRFSAGLVSGLNLIFFIGIFLLAAKGIYKMIQQVTPALLTLLTLPLLASAACVFLLLTLITAWEKPELKHFERAHYTVLVFVGGAFTWFLYTWNILGFRF